MRVLVCGDRNWTDGDLVIEEVGIRFYGDEGTVIHGNARGADKLGGIAAKHHGLEVEVYPAKWARYGRAAGPMRNQEMLDKGKPDLVLAFHDDLAHSKGTGDMVRRASLAGIPVEIISHAKKGEK